jgi:hypothetical protein
VSFSRGECGGEFSPCLVLQNGQRVVITGRVVVE